MGIDAKPAERNPRERIEQLKKISLDFSKKFTQPNFIVSEERIYQKQSSIEELNHSFNRAFNPLIFKPPVFIGF